MTVPTSSSLHESVYSGNGMGQHYTNPEHDVVRRALGLAEEISNPRVLDLACGRGIVSLTLAREKAAEHIVAGDINDEGLQDLEERADNEVLEIDVKKVDAADKDGFPADIGDEFDMVVAKDLYPFLDPRQGQNMLQNVSNSLRSGGWLLVTAPSTRSQLFTESIALGQNELYRKLGEAAKAHVQTSLDFFTFTDIERLAEQLRSVNLEMTEASHYGRANGWIAAIAQKYSVKE
ncbi:MAG TPA: class I SAM-dependent methyltransferase [Patescibacteria group bacterium]|nr:class I SAM-dependent methyltransferase [Patescibacteria group bacterium]